MPLAPRKKDLDLSVMYDNLVPHVECSMKPLHGSLVVDLIETLAVLALVLCHPAVTILTRMAKLFDSLLLLSFLFCNVASAETVLGAFIFHRHGDRTPKNLPPSNLTSLGYSQVFASGSYYRSRYLSTASPLRIDGISSDIVNLKQFSVSAPVDNVLESSAQGFVQGLYPAVGSGHTGDSETLANGSTVQAPLQGYQLVPIGSVNTGAGSEDSAWLQQSSSCARAQTSSNNFYYSNLYLSLSDSTSSFYTSLDPVVNGVMNKTSEKFKNAYTSTYLPDYPLPSSPFFSERGSPNILTSRNLPCVLDEVSAILTDRSLRLYQRRYNSQC